MKTLGIAVVMIAAAVALWAQAPPEGAGAAKGKAKAGRGVVEAKAPAAPTPPPVPQVLRLVRANTYLVTGHGSNSTFRVTPQGVILVNTKLPAAGDYERLAELIRGVTAQPVKFVFTTNARPESNGNNAKFQGAEVVTTERTVTLGGAEVRSVRVGENTLVFFPSEKLLCLGDVSKTDVAVSKLEWTLAIPNSGEPVYR